MEPGANWIRDLTVKNSSIPHPLQLIEYCAKRHYNLHLMWLMELKISNQRLRLGLGLGLITLFAFSCSTTPVKWYKPGVSQATFSRDKAECEDALLSTGTTQKLKDVYSFEGCMEAKGYRVAISGASQ